MEEQEFLVNQTKQIAVKAINHDEAFKKVISGEGKIVAMSMSVNPRPKPLQPQMAGNRIQGSSPFGTITKTPTTTVTQPT